MAALTDIVMQCHIELEGQFQHVVSVVRWAAWTHAVGDG